MSRIKVLPLQKDISVSISSPNIIVVRGKLGIIKKKINSVVLISLNHENIFITFSSKSRNARTQSGTVVSILSNMFTGVSVGFEKNSV
jgi:ribosomal protein L6P/L9E